MNVRPCFRRSLVIVFSVLFLSSATARANVIESAASGFWTNAATWVGGVVPAVDDQVMIAGGHAITLDNPTPALASLIITNATLMATNWTTVVTAETVAIRNGGVLTHHTCIISSNPGNTNRVHIVCDDLTIDAGGKIDVNIKGHPSALSAPANAQYWGQGPGPGYGSGGGGYGGRGARGGYGGAIDNGGQPYGSDEAPIHVGSGGGAHNGQLGGWGGGAVRIEATGTVTLNGAITANGGNRNGQAGAGSGGSIWIDCTSLLGDESAVLTAGGGNGGTHYYHGHAGGGGRIAVYYGDADYFIGTRDASAGTWGINADPVTPAEDGTLVLDYTGTDVLFTVTGSPEEYGNPTPYEYWYRPLAPGTVITNEVEQIVPGNDELRRWCLGWMAETNGISFASGVTTQAVFTLPAADTVQTWRWTNQWNLTVYAGVGGTASESVSGWYTNGTTVEISAVATGNFDFAQWSGDIPWDDRHSNPVTVTMDQARTIQATFVDTITQPRTWNGIGMWWESENWDPVGIPNDESPITIASGTATYDVPFTAASLVISNGATMRISRWESVMTVGGDVDIYGTLTHPLSDVDPATGLIPVTNRVALLCTNLTVHAGGAINANSVGFRGAIAIGDNIHQWGHGPGAGYRAAGGSYGGIGSICGYGGTTGSTYGTDDDPDLPGSGGGAHNVNNGGHGGGLVRIKALGMVTVNGSITVNGANFNGSSGGGSGGGVLIRCNVFASDNGLVSANGGIYSTAQYGGGGGGGGRIAIHYDPDAQTAANLVNPPIIRLSARSGWGSIQRGTPGTIWLTDSSFFPGNATTLYGGRLVIDDLTAWSATVLTSSTHVVAFPEGCAVNISGNLTLTGDGGIETHGPLTVGGAMDFDVNAYAISHFHALNESDITVGGDLIARNAPVYFHSSDQDRIRVAVSGDCLVTGGATLHVTSGIAPDYPLQPGSELIVGDDLTIAAASTLFLESHPTNGASPHITARNVNLATGGAINATARGFAGGPRSGNTWGYGPGGSFQSSGGSHGGLGGIGNSGGAVGEIYGDPEAPMEPGSGGGSSSSSVSGRGGGLVRLHATETVAIHGEISANGQHPNSTGGAGAGGAIYITCRFFEGDGVLSANGGGNRADTSSYGGGGGGGRIAVLRARHYYSGTATADGGVGFNETRSGMQGTVLWVDPPSGTILFLR